MIVLLFFEIQFPVQLSWISADTLAYCTTPYT